MKNHLSDVIHQVSSIEVLRFKPWTAERTITAEVSRRGDKTQGGPQSLWLSTLNSPFSTLNTQLSRAIGSPRMSAVRFLFKKHFWSRSGYRFDGVELKR